MSFFFVWYVVTVWFRSPRLFGFKLSRWISELWLSWITSNSWQTTVQMKVNALNFKVVRFIIWGCFVKCESDLQAHAESRDTFVTSLMFYLGNLLCKGFFPIESNFRQPLTPYTLTSVYMFSILVFVHFLRSWQKEFV